MRADTGVIINNTWDEFPEMRELQNSADRNAFLRSKSVIPLSEEQKKKIEPLGATQRKGFMRNQPCVCGSEKKFKKCCWDDYANGKKI